MKKTKKASNKKAKTSVEQKEVEITTLTYSRLINTGNYENIRVEAVAKVNGNPDVAFTKLVSWVNSKCKKMEEHDCDNIDECFDSIDDCFGC